eukprot:2857795-Prymnesium_polylepis.1
MESVAGARAHRLPGPQRALLLVLSFGFHMLEQRGTHRLMRNYTIPQRPERPRRVVALENAQKPARCAEGRRGGRRAACLLGYLHGLAETLLEQNRVVQHVYVQPEPADGERRRAV